MSAKTSPLPTSPRGGEIDEKADPPNFPKGRGVDEKANVLTPLLHNSLTPKEKAIVFNSLASETNDNYSNSFNF